MLPATRETHVRLRQRGNDAQRLGVGCNLETFVKARCAGGDQLRDDATPEKMALAWEGGGDGPEMQHSRIVCYIAVDDEVLREEQWLFLRHRAAPPPRHARWELAQF